MANSPLKTSFDARVSREKEAPKTESSLPPNVEKRTEALLRFSKHQSSTNVFGGSVNLSVQIVLPGGHSHLVDSVLGETVGDLKKRTLESLLGSNKFPSLSKYTKETLPIEKYVLKTVDTRKKLEEGKLLSEIPGIVESRQSGVTPSLCLFGNYAVDEKKKKEQKVKLEIGYLCGKPLCWAAEEDEIDVFKYKMRRIRQEEAKRLKLVKQNRTAPPEPPTTEEKGTVLTVKLPLTSTGKITAWFTKREINFFRCCIFHSE